MADELGEAKSLTKGFNDWKKAIEPFGHHVRSGLYKEAILKVQYLEQPGINVHALKQPTLGNFESLKR